MLATRVYQYGNPAAVMIGLRELGMTPRGLRHIAIDPRGETYIAVPEDVDAVNHVKVGDKMTLSPPWEGRYFHLDAVHRLPGDTVLWNGDRRLSDTGSARGGPRMNGRVVLDLHASGLTSAVVTQSGVLARKIGQPHLYRLDFASIRRGRVRDGWDRVHTSSVGNVLMIERRVLNYRLALCCVDGLVEIDISGLPERVVEVEHLTVPRPIGVVGRIEGGPFAVTTGDIEPWGFANIRPRFSLGPETHHSKRCPDWSQSRRGPSD